MPMQNQKRPYWEKHPNKKMMRKHKEKKHFLKSAIDRATRRHRAREHAFSLVSRLHGKGLDNSVGRIREAFQGFADPVPEAEDIKANWKNQGFDELSTEDINEQRNYSWNDFRKQLYELADYQILMEAERLNEKPEKISELSKKNIERKNALELDENPVLQDATYRFMKLLTKSKLRKHPIIRKHGLTVLAYELAMDFAEEQRKMGNMINFNARDR